MVQGVELFSQLPQSPHNCRRIIAEEEFSLEADTLVIFGQISVYDMRRPVMEVRMTKVVPGENAETDGLTAERLADDRWTDGGDAVVRCNGELYC